MYVGIEFVATYVRDWHKEEDNLFRLAYACYYGNNFFFVSLLLVTVLIVFASCILLSANAHIIMYKVILTNDYSSTGYE